MCQWKRIQQAHAKAESIGEMLEDLKRKRVESLGSGMGDSVELAWELQRRTPKHVVGGGLPGELLGNGSSDE